MTTVLSIVQDFTDKVGLPTPSALVGSAEKSVKQFRGLLRELVEDLGEYSFPSQTLRKTWTSLAGADQGALTTIFGTGYSSLVTDTLWNETRRVRIYGPVSENVWQQLQTLPNAGPEFSSWITGGKLYVSPVMVAGETLSGVYHTKFGVLSVDGVTTKAGITADDDSLLFPDIVVRRGLEYKWRKAKGEAGWEDDYNSFISAVAKNVVKDSAAKLNLSVENVPPRPGIVIPFGSWNV